jgi:hypothetical protein
MVIDTLHHHLEIRIVIDTRASEYGLEILAELLPITGLFRFGVPTDIDIRTVVTLHIVPFENVPIRLGRVFPYRILQCYEIDAMLIVFPDHMIGNAIGIGKEIV